MTRFGLLFGLLLTSSLWGAGYTLADLEVLTQEGNFDEFFSHALDVRPSERQEAWKGMVSKMSDGYARHILAKSELTREHFKRIENIYTWPTLATDDVFKAHRQEIGLKYLKTCLKKTDPCWNDFKTFWEADKNNPDTAFKLAELSLELPDKPISTWVFLDVALKSSLSEFYCKKEFVLESVWGKLEIDYIRLGTSGDFLKKIDETVHPECLIPLNQMAFKKLNKPEKLSDREVAYQMLAAQGKINSGLTDFFYTVYLLENPSKGELFNYAWNRLTELSRSVDRREEVLKKIKTLDPLPDELFASLDEAKKTAILNHFKNKFPEYLYFYADQCLMYYGGKTAFPDGNPTMKCQNLMEQDTARTLVGEDKVQRFLKAISI